MKTIIITILLSLTIFLNNKSVFKYTAQSYINKDKFFEIKYEDILKEGKPAILSQIALKVEYIALETNKDCLISALAKYYFSDSLIFVSDKDHILKFSIKGKFLKKIGQPGRGPGELNSIWMTSIIPDKKMIVVHDATMRKMTYFSFNGELLKTLSVPSLAYIKVMNDGRYIAFDSGSSVSERYTFRLTNESGDTISVINNNRPWTNKSGGAMMFKIPSFEPFYTYQNRYFFKTIYNDTIYVVNGDRIIPNYFINLGKYKLPEEKRVEKLNAQEARSFQENASKYFFSNVFEAEGRIFLTTNNYANGKTINFIINKKSHIEDSSSKNSEVSKGILLNDWDGGLFFWPKGNVNNNQVFMPIEVIRLKKYLESDNSAKIPVKYPEERKQLKILLSKLDIANNPIIMVVTLKPNK